MEFSFFYTTLDVNQLINRVINIKISQLQCCCILYLPIGDLLIMDIFLALQFYHIT